MVKTTFSVLVSARSAGCYGCKQREKLYAWACIGEAVWALVVPDITMELGRRCAGTRGVHRCSPYVPGNLGRASDHHRTSCSVLGRCASARAVQDCCGRRRVLRARPCSYWFVSAGQAAAHTVGVTLRDHCIAPDVRSAQACDDRARAVGARPHRTAGRGISDAVASQFVTSAADSELAWAKYVGMLSG